MKVMNLVLEGKIGVGEAASTLGLSERQGGGSLRRIGKKVFRLWLTGTAAACLLTPLLLRSGIG